MCVCVCVNTEQYQKNRNKELSMVTVSSPHFVIFPFMSQSHTIPLLNLARVLHHRHISVTVFTTPANSPSIHTSLHDIDIDVSVIELPFPEIPGIPPGVESTNKLESMSSFLQFLNATKLIQPHFEQALGALRCISCIISDAFLGWTQQSAAKLGIPRLVFYGMSNFALALSEIMILEQPHAGVSSDDEPFSVPNFRGLNLTKNDFEPHYHGLDLKDPCTRFIFEQRLAVSKSHGLVVNSFYELEPAFNDYWNHVGRKAWCVGPLCLAKPPKSHAVLQKPTWVQWLDAKGDEGKSVLYVAFGSQAKMSHEQLSEIALGLEQSKVNFLWVLRSKELEFLKGFEERVKERGMIVKVWVDQMEILGHKGVKGFLSHCGWNSVMESICAGVPILAMPLMAEQHLNARMVVEEIGIGLRVLSRNGSVRGEVGSEEVEKMARELMEGNRGEHVRKKVKEIGENACAAMKEGGSSWLTLDLLIHDICGLPKSN